MSRSASTVAPQPLPLLFVGIDDVAPDLAIIHPKIQALIDRQKDLIILHETEGLARLYQPV